MSGDENTAKDTRAMVGACSFLALQFSASVILNHHVGNNAEAKHRARGSSAWRASLDAAILVENTRDVIEIKQTKQKDAQLQESKYMEFQQVTLEGWQDEDGEPVTSCVVVKAEKPVKVKSKPVEKEVCTLRDAWLASGGEVVDDDMPFITRSALKEFLMKDGDKTEKRVYNIISPKGDLIGKLTEHSVIVATETGWKVIDDQVAAEFLILR
jgi:hypothetical protein